MEAGLEIQWQATEQISDLDPGSKNAKNCYVVGILKSKQLMQIN